MHKKTELPLGQTNFTTAEIAALVGISTTRVRQLLADGKLRGQKLGRDWVIHRSDLQAYLDKRGGR